MPVPAAAPSADQFVDLARSLAHRLANVEADEDDLTQTGLIALHEALQKTTPSNPPGFAKVVMRRRMRTYYRRKQPEFVDLDAPVVEEEDGAALAHEFLADDSTPNPIDDTYLRDYLGELERVCGKTARFVAENLLAPGESVGRFVLAEVEQKRRQREAGLSVRGVDTIRVSNRVLAEALGLRDSTWREVLAEVRQFTTEWMQRGKTSARDLQGR